MTAETLFNAALALPPSDRAAYLDAHCADAAQRCEIEALLVAHDASSPLDATRGYVAPSSEGAAVGAAIGPYRLLEKIGEGGMGEVWVAEQRQPVKRLVALKLIRDGLAGPSALARFEAERQALALMDHPNIARVLDAGTTSDGRPYFVMELVKGVPITRFCDDNKLSPRQRLELFVQACQAIQHAHTKGVIHRDVKPSNVLVALYDDVPVVKVIDFGIAKATAGTLTEATLFTQFGSIVGTLEYMSPEQAKLNALDIDTRTDVYSLGVLLYELLTGSLPVERARLKQVALDECLRLIREEEPPRMSARLSATSQAAGGVESKNLARVVRGELDWIAMRALEKDRARRYESPAALARDVERHLQGEAVEACPPTWGYRLRKWLGRNRTAAVRVAVTLTLLMTLLVAGLLGWSARQQAEQRWREKAREALDRGILEALSARFDHAERALDEAHSLGESHPDLWTYRGLTAFYRGQFNQAADFLDRAIEMDPEAVAPRALRVLSMKDTEVWRDVIHHQDAALRLRPRTAEDHLFRGYLQYYDDPAIGIREVEQARRMRPSILAQVMRAEIRVWDAEDEDDLDRAIELAARAVHEAKDALVLVPESSVTRFVHVACCCVAAMANRRAGKAERAGEYLREAEADVKWLKENATDAGALLNRWRFHWVRGDLPVLDDEMRRAAEKGDAWAGMVLMNREMDRGNFAAALRHAESIHSPEWKTLFVALVVMERDGDATGFVRLNQERAGQGQTSDEAMKSILNFVKAGALAEAREWAERFRRQGLETPPSTTKEARELGPLQLSFLRGEATAADLEARAKGSRWLRAAVYQFLALEALARSDKAEAERRLREWEGLHVLLRGDPEAAPRILNFLQSKPDWPKWIKGNPK